MFNQNQIRMFVSLVVGGIVLYFGYFLATHGRVSVLNKSNDSVIAVEVRNDSSLKKQVTLGTWSLLRSGSYIVRNDVSGHVRMAQVSVPGWLQKATITYQDVSSAKVERVAALTYENFLPSDAGSLVSYTDLDGYTSGYTIHNPVDAFGGKYTDVPFGSEVSSPITTTDGMIASLSTEKINRYSFQSKTQQTIGTMNLTEYGPEDAFYLQRSSNTASTTMGIYEQGTHELRVVSPSGQIVKYASVQSGARGVVFDVTDNGWVMVRNTGNPVAGSKLKNEEVPIPFTITVFNTKTDKQFDIDIGDAKSVDIVTLSPDEKYIAVNKDGQLWVFEAATKKVIMVNPFTRTNQLLWQGGKLYSISTDLGIAVLNPQTRQISSVTTNDTGALSFSRVIPVGQKLYVTAYNTKLKSKLPDGYVIDLAQKSDGVTESLSTVLPIKTNDYDINYLSNTIYVRINPQTLNARNSAADNERVKKLAQQQLSKVMRADILKKCTVVYIN